MRLRMNIALQRLLARLPTISPDRWIPKCGWVLDFTLSGRPRVS
jgi:hypothetical protein